MKYLGLVSLEAQQLGAMSKSELDALIDELRHVGIPAGEHSDVTEAGWNDSSDKRAEGLLGQKQHKEN